MRATFGMHKPKSINELLRIGGKRLSDLKTKSLERNVALEHVKAALPPKLADAVMTAGIEEACLTLGVAGAPWAARLRYVTDDLRTRVGTSMNVELQKVRIKVIPPRA